MQVFISESVCGGAWPAAEFPASLVREGRAMLFALVEDASRLPDVHVATTWDSRLDGPSWPNVSVHRCNSPRDESRLFARLCASSDRTLVIAPEIDGLMERRCRDVETLGGRLAGPDALAVAMCADKLALSGHLESLGIATIPTRPFDRSRPTLSQITFPAVIKPRDGCGSVDTWLLNSAGDLKRLRDPLQEAPHLRSAVWQPWIQGRALSVAVLIDPQSGTYVPWPVAEQRLSDDGRFQYLGGCIPARDATADVPRLAVEACRSVPGLRGYVGVDLLQPEKGPPLVVEINPRLTTSYLGYRALTKTNLAVPVLFPERCAENTEWGKAVEFLSDGTVAHVS